MDSELRKKRKRESSALWQRAAVPSVSHVRLAEGGNLEDLRLMGGRIDELEGCSLIVPAMAASPPLFASGRHER
jgi:hypothetical protein